MLIFHYIGFKAKTNIAFLTREDVEVPDGPIGSVSQNNSGCSTVSMRRIQISIQRKALNQQDVEEMYSTGETSKQNLIRKVIQKVKKSCMCSLPCLLSFLKERFPILQWLLNYPVKEYLLSDLISAFTTLFLHIPQGMAYGLLASVDPVNGLYTSFFPVVIYCMMGTSRQVSVGTMAVISLMVGSAPGKLGAVSKQDVVNSNLAGLAVNLSFNTTDQVLHSKVEVDGSGDPFCPPTNLEVVVSLCLITGLFQIVMGILHLGSLTVVFSDQFVSGFCTGTSVLVVVSQLKYLFGIPARQFTGPFKVIYSSINIFSILKNANPTTVLIAAISILILAVVKEQINARFREKLKLPIPIDLVVVVLATLVSYMGEFNKNYGVDIIGEIPTGLPEPVAPRMDLIPSLVVDGFAVSAVSYTISYSLAQIFAKKHQYVVDANQELLAIGSANLFSSFFACFPCAAALSRSLVQEKSGGKTQLASLISCALMVVILLALAPLFYHLPKCILSSVILVALKGMFVQVLELKRVWNISKIDGMIWIMAFLSIVILDIDYGLILGVVFSILTVVYRSFVPYQVVLANLPDTEIYVDKEHFSSAQEILGIKIFCFRGPLYFMNKSIFMEGLKQVIANNRITKNNRKEWHIEEDQNNIESLNPIHHVVIDCSSFSYIDLSGVDTLLELTKEMKDKDITVYLAGCTVPAYRMLQKTKFLVKIPQPSVFPTVHDAVKYAQQTSTRDVSINMV
ncbi:prestin-like isoform X2 [Tachypleus tridentatus]|uniref:prestin-like isoform X2 n=1 Tax=Tachypleus tridentatus TaxID=6853 RepID=UPI003FD3017A